MQCLISQVRWILVRDLQLSLQVPSDNDSCTGSSSCCRCWAAIVLCVLLRHYSASIHEAQQLRALVGGWLLAIGQAAVCVAALMPPHSDTEMLQDRENLCKRRRATPRLQVEPHMHTCASVKALARHVSDSWGELERSLRERYIYAHALYKAADARLGAQEVRAALSSALAVEKLSRSDRKLLRKLRRLARKYS
jgi:hypothetical protein